MKISALMQAFNHCCVYCGRRVIVAPYIAVSGWEATIDHDMPKARGGFDVLRPSNTVLACRRCNQAKADMTGAEFIEFRNTLKFPASYVAYLEKRRIKQLGDAESQHVVQTVQAGSRSDPLPQDQAPLAG